MSRIGAQTVCNSCAACPSDTVIQVSTDVAANAFLSCTRITSVTIPETVTSIGANAFKGCTKLATISFTPRTNALTLTDFFCYNWLMCYTWNILILARNNDATAYTGAALASGLNLGIDQCSSYSANIASCSAALVVSAGPT
eukprot:gene40147-49654_t